VRLTFKVVRTIIRDWRSVLGRFGYRYRCIVTVLLSAMLTAGVGVAPEPSIATKAWQVDMVFHDPQRITLRLPGDDHDTTFWYVLYTVTNDTDRDVPFYPTFDLVTDKLQVIEGGSHISPTVYRAIKARYAKAYPFFVYPSEMYGPLLQGSDNAKTSCVAFVPPDPSVNHFVLYVGGLSGEIVKTRNHDFDTSAGESMQNPRFFTLRKTLAISYDVPGDEKTRLQTPPVRGSLEWVMR